MILIFSLILFLTGVFSIVFGAGKIIGRLNCQNAVYRNFDCGIQFHDTCSDQGFCSVNGSVTGQFCVMTCYNYEWLDDETCIKDSLSVSCGKVIRQ